MNDLSMKELVNELVNELDEGILLAKELQSNSSNEQIPVVDKILAKFQRSLQILGNDTMRQTQFQPTVSPDSPSTLSGQIPKNQDLIEHKIVGKRIRSRIRSRIEEPLPISYGSNWRKYGQKDILGAKYPSNVLFDHGSASSQEVSHLSSSTITTAIDDPKLVSSLVYGSGREDDSITDIQSEHSLVPQGFRKTFLKPWSCRKLYIMGLVIIATIRIRALVLKETHKFLMALQEPMLSCCLFPHNHEIEIDTLVQLWMSAGLLENMLLEEVVFRQLRRHKGYSTQMEDVGNWCFDLFEKRKFILYSRTDTISGKKKYIIKTETIKSILDELQVACTTQDLILDQCTSTTKDGYTMLDDENATNGANQLWHVSVVFKHIDQTIFEILKKHRELRTLLFIPNYGYSLTQIPSNFFLALRLLQTLDLSGSHIIELPSSIGHLTHLHYLDLSFTLIEGLPESIGRLTELQTLKLKDCNRLFDLPKGMKNLTNLRHLEFDILGQLTSMPEGIGALTELRTLAAFIVENEEGYNIRELQNLNNLSGSLCISGLDNVCLEDDLKIANLGKKEHLSQLELRWNPYNLMDHIASIADLTPNALLEELHLICYPLPQFPGWMGDDKLCAKLVSISLTKCENTELDICLGELPQLKHLEITKMDGVTAVGSFLGGQTKFRAFPKLETLIIDGMASLEFWEGADDQDFPRLLKFRIKHCPKLIQLLSYSCLGSLEHLEVSRCTMLRSLPGLRFPHLPGRRLGSLKTLIINDCPLLKQQYSKDGADWNNIVNVQNIWIDLKDIHEPQSYGSEDESTTTGSLSDADFD